MRTYNYMQSTIYYLWVAVCFWAFVAAAIYGVTQATKGMLPVYADSERVDIERVTLSNTERSVPIHAHFPTLNHSVSIENGIYDTESKTWTLSSDSAHYALASSEPSSNAGNTFIYGHNTPDIFGLLDNLSIGDRVKLTLASGDVLQYQLVTKSEVAPTDMSAFDYNKQPVLTLQTCSGVWNEKRSMYSFVLEESA